MTEAGSVRTLAEGDIVFFHCLHLDQVRRISEQTNSRNNFLYEVEGKPRPMIVFGVFHEGVEGRRWFRVLQLSRNGSPAAKRRGYRRIGAVLDDAIISYAKISPLCYPENLVDGNVRKRLNPLALNSISGIMGLKLRPGTA